MLIESTSANTLQKACRIRKDLHLLHGVNSRPWILDQILHTLFCNFQEAPSNAQIFLQGYIYYNILSNYYCNKQRKEKKRKKSFHGGNDSHELKLNYGIAPLSRNLKQGFSLGGRKQSICTHLGFIICTQNCFWISFFALLCFRIQNSRTIGIWRWWM